MKVRAGASGYRGSLKTGFSETIDLELAASPTFEESHVVRGVGLKLAFHFG